MVIDGRAIAKEITSQLSSTPKPDGFFGAVLVGDDPASLGFLDQKRRVADRLGIDFRLYRLPKDIATDGLRKEIGRLSGVRQCTGFIVQLPVPGIANVHYVLNAIPKQKDPDLLSEHALGAFYTGRHTIVPPAVATVEEILGHQDLLDRMRELRVVLVGAGFLIGRPVGFWLQDKVKELIILNSAVKNVPAHLGDADVVISGAGAGKLFAASHLKEGTLVIDFGLRKETSGIVGDFEVDADVTRVSYTPTPGGTGPVLVAKLFENYYKLGASR